MRVEEYVATRVKELCVKHKVTKPDTEDRDVEIIINNLLDIGRHLSLKMYDYGYFFASNKV